MTQALKWGVFFRCAGCAALITASGFDASAQVIAYPSAGQSPEEQAVDKAACQEFAKSQTGFDPQAALGASSTQSPPPTTAILPRRKAKQELAEEGQQQKQLQQKLQAYNKAETVCYKGRGYAVG